MTSGLVDTGDQPLGSESFIRPGHGGGEALGGAEFAAWNQCAPGVGELRTGSRERLLILRRLARHGTVPFACRVDPQIKLYNALFRLDTIRRQIPCVTCDKL